MTSNAASAGIDPREVLAAVDWTDAEDFTPVEGGWDNLIWRFESADGRSHALRLYRLSADTDALATAAAWEERALRRALAAGLPAPALEASGTYGGAPFTVQEWLPGRPLLASLERTPWRIWSLGRAFGRLQAQTHMLAPAELRRPDPYSWVGDRAIAEQMSLLGLWDAVRKQAANDAFCHFDYHPLNVLVAGSRITALLDFPNASLGDRRADLARTQALLSAAPLPPGPLKPLLQLARGWFIGAWKRGYEAEAGPTFPLDPLFEAWGAATALGDQVAAVEDARGWAERDDIGRVRAYFEGRLAAAGLSLDGAGSG